MDRWRIPRADSFDGGRRRALNDEARAAYDSEVASYRETVLTGFQQVEDNLAALGILEKEAGSRQPPCKQRSGGSISPIRDTTASHELSRSDYGPESALTDEVAAVNILG